MTQRYVTSIVLAAAALAGACTVSNTEPPPLMGPSEMALSLSITASPDVLSLDGASQSQIAVEARDVNGQPAPNIPLRLEILVDGTLTDFGVLSARTLVTGSNGRAVFTYTAPNLVTGVIPNLSISVTPTGTDAAAHLRRLINIRLVPPGVIGVAPSARFTFTPAAPIAFSNVLFDGSTSTAGIGATITNYLWDFGDNTTGTGITATHQYSAPGTYRVTLTVTDSNGLVAQATPQFLVVSPGQPPTATFIFSPAEPAPGEPVFFNASQSTPGTNHRIVSYRWNWGDGTPNATGVTRSHTFATVGTYRVVLTVTDEVGQTATALAEVTVE